MHINNIIQTYSDLTWLKLISAWPLLRFLHCHDRGLGGVCLGWWGNSFTCSSTYPYSTSSSRPSVPSQWVRPEHAVMSPGEGPVGVFSRWHRHGPSGGGRAQTGAHHCLPLHWRSEAFPVLAFFFSFCFALRIFSAFFRSFYPAILLLLL